MRPEVVEGSLGILLSGSLDGGHLVRVKNHKADLVNILNIFGIFNVLQIFDVVYICNIVQNHQ